MHTVLLLVVVWLTMEQARRRKVSSHKSKVAVGAPAYTSNIETLVFSDRIFNLDPTMFLRLYQFGHTCIKKGFYKSVVVATPYKSRIPTTSTLTKF